MKATGTCGRSGFAAFVLTLLVATQAAAQQRLTSRDTAPELPQEISVTVAGHSELASARVRKDAAETSTIRRQVTVHPLRLTIPFALNEAETAEARRLLGFAARWRDALRREENEVRAKRALFENLSTGTGLTVSDRGAPDEPEVQALRDGLYALQRRFETAEKAAVREALLAQMDQIRETLQALGAAATASPGGLGKNEIEDSIEPLERWLKEAEERLQYMRERLPQLLAMERVLRGRAVYTIADAQRIQHAIGGMTGRLSRKTPNLLARSRVELAGTARQAFDNEEIKRARLEYWSVDPDDMERTRAWAEDVARLEKALTLPSFDEPVETPAGQLDGEFHHFSPHQVQRSIRRLVTALKATVSKNAGLPSRRIAPSPPSANTEQPIDGSVIDTIMEEKKTGSSWPKEAYAIPEGLGPRIVNLRLPGLLFARNYEGSGRYETIRYKDDGSVRERRTGDFSMAIDDPRYPQASFEEPEHDFRNNLGYFVMSRPFGADRIELDWQGGTPRVGMSWTHGDSTLPPTLAGSTADAVLEIGLTGRNHGEPAKQDTRTEIVSTVSIRVGPLAPAAEAPELAEEEDRRYEFNVEPPRFQLISGYKPENPRTDEDFVAGFRLVNTPYMSAAGVALHIGFFDADSGEPITDFTPREGNCRASGTTFRCPLGGVGYRRHADFSFAGKMPSGGVRWAATWTSAGGTSGATGAQGQIMPAQPSIVDVVVLEEQTAFENGIPKYEYPFAPGKPDLGEQRYLMLIGRNLPGAVGDPVDLSSPDAGVRYRFLDFPDTKNPGYREKYERGWNVLRRQYRNAAAPAKVEELDALLVRADLNEKVLPGDKTIRLNGVSGAWKLQFGDLEADLRFVRRINPRLLEPTETLYNPERVYLRLKLNAPLPIHSIPVVFDTDPKRLEKEPRYRTVLKSAPDFGPNIFLSPPIDLIERGKPGNRPGPARSDAIAVEIEGPGGLITARIEPEYRLSHLLVPYSPDVARASIRRTPDRMRKGERISWLWKDALKRAAICNDISVENWRLLSEADFDEIHNYVVFKGVFNQDESVLKTKIQVGDQAAAILVRDLFGVLTEEYIPALRQIAEKDVRLYRLLTAMRRLAMDDRLPLNFVKVSTPDGTDIPYRNVVMNDPPFLAELYGISEEAVFHWQVEQTRIAVRRLAEAAKAAVEQARAIGDCDAEDLINLVGHRMGAVAARLLPRLVKLQESSASSAGGRRLFWQPDPEGRRWVARLRDLGDQLRRQRKIAEADTELVLAALTVASLPVALSEAPAALVAAAVIDIVDVSSSVYFEVSQYLEGQAEREFALGAALAAGTMRLKEAERDANDLLTAALQSYFAVVTGVSGAVDSIRTLSKTRLALRLREGADVARHVLRKGTKALGTLRGTRARDFLTLIAHARMKVFLGATSAISDVERKALALIEGLRPAVKPSSSNPDIPSHKVDRASAEASNELPPDSKRPVRFSDETVGGEPEMLPAPQPETSATDIFTEGATPIEPGRLAEAPPGDEFFSRGFDDDFFNGDLPNAPARRTAGDPSDEMFRLAEALPESVRPVPNTEFVFVDADGVEVRYRLGEKLSNRGAEGAASHSFAYDVDEDKVLRITPLSTDPTNITADEVGAEIVDALDSSTIRTPRVHSEHVILFEDGRPATRVALIERVKTGERVLAENGGELPQRYLDAVRRGLRELNESGAAWLDFKSNNFGFSETDSGLQVVVFDTGGIVPMIGDEPAETARALQRVINGRFDTVFPDQAGTADEGQRIFYRMNAVAERFGDSIDIARLKIESAVQLMFNPRGGERIHQLWGDFASP